MERVIGGRQVIGVYFDIEGKDSFSQCELMLVLRDKMGDVWVAGGLGHSTPITDRLIDGTDINADIVRGISERLRILRAA